MASAVANMNSPSRTRDVTTVVLEDDGLGAREAGDGPADGERRRAARDRDAGHVGVADRARARRANNACLHRGCVRTVTLYAAPLATGVAKFGLPLVVAVRLSPPLS